MILASGRGSNFATLADAVSQGTVPNAEILSLISNRADAGAIELARERGIPHTVIESRKFRKDGKFARSAYEEVLHQTLEDLSPDLICLAGYMLILGETLVKQWEGKMVNIHPSLLPLFRGLHPQAQALEAGVCFTGCTVHFVTAELDGGPIIEQDVLRIEPNDTAESLAARLLPIEHRTYVRALARLTSNSYTLSGNRVIWK